MRSRFLTILLITQCLMSQDAYPCTAFLLSNGRNFSVGKSFDWKASHAVAYLNTKWRRKTALANGDPADTLKEWKAVYGSLTFSQFGPEFPLGGINEKGLVVEILWLPETEYPTRLSQKTINELQWIQYILDTSASVPDAIVKANAVQIKKQYADVHYFVCDAEERCAAFEYLNGVLKKPEILTSRQIQVLTNSTYDSSKAFALNYAPFGGTESIPSGNGSLERFVKVGALSRELGRDREATTIASAKKTLEAARDEDSQWQIVYSSKFDGNAPIYIDARFRLLRNNTNFTFSINNRDFNCKTQSVLVYDISGDMTGTVGTRFVPNTLAMTKEVLRLGSDSHENVLSVDDIKHIANYTQSFPCGDGDVNARKP